jgi:hypothetical protein
MKKLLIFAVLACLLAWLILKVLPRSGTPPVAKVVPPVPVWNSGAVRGLFTGLQIHELDPTHAELIFSYDLENNADMDYQLTKGPSTVVMTRLKSSATLSSEQPVELDHSVFLPARNRIRVSLKIARPFNWPTGLPTGQVGPVNQDKFRTLVSQEVGGITGFVLFDQATHLQIELPCGWQDLRAPNAVAQLE